MYKPIKCNLYDYIEIACMKSYTLNLELIDGSDIKLKAKNTRIKDAAEYLVGTLLGNTTDELKEETEIRLDQIIFLEPTDKNAQFGRIRLNGD